MTKRKSITLLVIFSIIMAAVIFFTFVRFSFGINKEKQYLPAFGAVTLDYDIEGGKVYTLKLSDDNEEEVEDIGEVLETLEYRLNALGYSAHSVKAVKSTDKDVLDYEIRVEMADKDTANQDIAVIAAYGEVQFFGGTEANPTERILEGVKVVDNAKYVGAYTDEETGTKRHQVAIEFTKEGYDALIEKINSASSYYVEVKLGDQVLLQGSSPIKADYFAEKTLGVTSPSEAGAKQMVLQIVSGGLNYKYTIEEGGETFSIFGERASTRIALAVAFTIVTLMIAFIIAYKGLGTVAGIGKAVFFISGLWLLVAVPNVVVSMNGLFGALLAIILYASSLIVTCNRVKEEYSHSEKTVKAAINKGFRKSFIPVLGMHVVSGVFAILLLIFATGTLRSFAAVFGILVAVSFVCSTALTRIFTALLLPLYKDKENFLHAKKEVR
ncbi:MAG: hypothetical protein IJC07_00640 [Clostridia bacterium]|nr:hypothetical protein [Clostridia bacterium]